MQMVLPKTMRAMTTQMVKSRQRSSTMPRPMPMKMQMSMQAAESMQMSTLVQVLMWMAAQMRSAPRSLAMMPMTPQGRP